MLVLKRKTKNSSTQFPKVPKNELLDLQEHFERYCNALSVFGFSSARYDIKVLKSYLLPILLNERDNEPTVFKKTSHFDSCKFGIVQLLDILNFLGGATDLDSFLRAYTISETKGFYLFDWFNHPDKLNDKELPPY